MVWPEIGARSLAIGPASHEGDFVLALDEETGQSDVWSLTIRGPNAGQARPLLESPNSETTAAFSPDGQTIAYRSNALSDNDVWVCDSNGANQRRVTRIGFRIVGSPRWSPDGRAVTFHSRHEGQGEIYVAEIETGNTRVVSPDPADDALPDWSADGRFLYFSSRRGGDYGIWRAPAEGGPAIEVAKPRTGRAQASPHNDFVYYVRSPGNSLCRRILNEGEPVGSEECILNGLEGRSFRLGNGGIYFTRLGVLHHLDLETGDISELVPISRSPSSISPDGSTALHEEWTGRGRDLLLLTRQGTQ